MRELFHQPPKQRVDPKIPQNVPVYRILAEKGFFGPDDTLHPEGEIIILHDVPNEDMEPMNDLARVAYEAYVDTLEESAKIVARTNGRHFAGRPRSKEEMLANASEDARRIQSVSNPEGVKIMGARMDTSKRIEMIGDNSIPDVGMDAAKKKRAKIETLSSV